MIDIIAFATEYAAAIVGGLIMIAAGLGMIAALTPTKKDDAALAAIQLVLRQIEREIEELRRTLTTHKSRDPNP